jgi:hypothetical protein
MIGSFWLQILKHRGAQRDSSFYESTSIGKEDLRQMQGHPPQGCGAGDLRQLET